MKKITISLARLFIATLLTLNFNFVNAQQFKFHAEYEPSWYGPGFNMVQDIPGYVKTTLQANSADDQFVIEADNGYNRWKKNGLSLTTNINEVGYYEWTAGLTLSDNFLTTAAIVNHYYTFRLKNVGYQSTQGVMMETNNAPVLFAAANAVSQNPLANAVSQNTPVVITFNLASVPSPQEKVYVRYTTDGFATSTVVQGTLNGGSGSTSGTVSIPGQVAGTVVSYYLLTSTFTLTNPLSIEADLATLNLKNNEGSNYLYTVASAPAATVNVTFRVNMSQQAVSADGIHIAGTFNGFSTTANEMTSVGAGIYETTIAIAENSTVRYKFINGNSFSVQENVPQACGVDNGLGGFDRNLTVFAEPLILPLVCFNECSNCVVPNTINLTFRVNMSQQTVSADGVHLAGSFNGFSSTATPMLAVGGGIYEAQITIDEGVTAQYVFINGNTFATQETVPAGCGVNNGFGGFNRSIVTPNANTILPLVCFSSCTNCIIPAAANVTFRVNMSLQTVNATGVHLAGSFNGFSSTANPMTLVGNGIYEATVSIDTTLTVQYVFLNGNSFTNQESVPSSCGVDNGFGGFNRSLVIPNSNTTIPAVCFSSCVNCIIPTTSNVIFRVNMSQQTVGTNGVHVSGSFNNWNPSGTPMTLTTNGVYEATVAITAGTTIQYKFINGNTFATQETVPSACGVANDVGGFDREITVGATDETLPIVCFGECSNCVIPGLSSVTFRVNMSLQTVNAAGVFLAGSFNSFSPTANAMILVGNGIYEATVSIDTTLTIQYVFLNGNTFANQELVPSSCGVDNGFGGFNRSLVIPNSNTVIPTVCFGSCSNCVLPILAQVTFYVNMSEETISPSGVFLAGSFNNFNTTANPMTNVGGGIFKTEVSIDTTAIVQYKFINGTTFESVPSVCGVDDGFGGFNRSIVVPEAEIFALPIVCFSSCENCVPNAIENTNSTKLSFAPNPTSSSIAIINGESLKSISVIDNLGKELMFIANNNRGVVSIDLSSLSSGIYFVKCFTDKETFTQKIIKQ